MLLRTLPDFVSAHAEVQQSFNSKWGRENCIVWGRARRSKFGPRMHSLSIRAAWGGEERCQFDGRTVAVDDDSFLILNNGRVCTTQIDAPQPVESFAIYFGPALVEHTYGAMTLSIEKALERGDAVVERSAEFLESLQPHDKLVSPVLRFIRLHVLRGVDDEAWYDEQLNFLLERMLTHRGGVIERIDALQLIRTSTRREIYRRISLATDYLHSNYRQPLDLDSLGKAACLSKYHFLRLFTRVHGITPHQYLLRKRAKTALRLLQTTPLDVCEIASSVGFAQRHALLRQMRRWTGLSPRQIRRAESVPALGS
ncbi:MAG TPA: AraC family transcriptional regulator [Steroidobacteraceae bacterium]|jgi:AraC family transcriptional regulator|nr:AraC family transcriptional regulator [Steroidobacteraceae bacterium]